MPDGLAEARQELALANRILAHEGVVDAFGHVSMRHPQDPGRYLISRHRACELVEPGDILEFTLDSIPVTSTNQRLYSELVIHGCIYQARPDVNSVCHHHAVSVLPYAISGTELVPVVHLGATLGGKVPFWDSRDEFGDTPLVVTKPDEGRSLAKALGEHWMVLLRRHGATVAGRSLRECVFRSIYGCRNAELQSRAMAMAGPGLGGAAARLSNGEIENCSGHSLTPRTIGRAWEYWTVRLQKSDPGFGRASKARSAPTTRSASPRKSGRKPTEPTHGRGPRRTPSAGRKRTKRQRA
jgi:ribulose-5-phosphate 4-epimerase/fuculose-1-phosphate aldolase